MSRQLPSTPVLAGPRRPTRRMMAAIAAAGLVAGLMAAAESASATQTAYFVDCSARSAGAGTEKSPWNTLATVNRHPGGFSAGDSIRLKAGTICTGQLAATGSGSSAAPILIASYGRGARPIVDPKGAAEAAVLVKDQSHWIISGLDVRNTASTGAQRSGILVEATDNSVHQGIVVRGNLVQRVAGISDRYAPGRYSSAGILVRTPQLGSAATGSFDGITIQGNSVRDVDCMGIAIVGGDGKDANRRNSHVLVSGNRVDRAGADSILVGVSTSPLIEHNVSNDAGYEGKDRGAIAAIWGYTSSDPTFQFNVATGTLPSADSEPWDCDWGITGTCLYQYNYSRDNTGGFFLDCTACVGTSGPDVVVRYNISVNEARVVSTSGSPNVQMYNNTFYAPGQSFSIPLHNGTLENNIFVGSGFSSTGATLRSNLYFGFDAPTEDSSAVTGDPHFRNLGASSGLASAGAYALTRSSPAIGAGTVVAENGGRDFFGNPVSASLAPNIGAYQGHGLPSTARFHPGQLRNPRIHSGSSVPNSGLEEGLVN